MLNEDAKQWMDVILDETNVLEYWVPVILKEPPGAMGYWKYNRATRTARVEQETNS